MHDPWLRRRVADGSRVRGGGTNVAGGEVFRLWCGSVVVVMVGRAMWGRSARFGRRGWGTAMAYVVVGVDGSAQSIRALRVAAQEARCRSARLHVVYVFAPVPAREVGTVATVTATASPASSAAMLREAYRRSAAHELEARQRAEGRLGQVVREAGSALDGVAVERTVVSDEHPSAALIGLAGNADLLVVGSRGFGGFKGLLLGSVSQQCVQHATCPVLVVRPKPEE